MERANDQTSATIAMIIEIETEIGIATEIMIETVVAEAAVAVIVAAAVAVEMIADIVDHLLLKNAGTAMKLDTFHETAQENVRMIAVAIVAVAVVGDLLVDHPLVAAVEVGAEDAEVAVAAVVGSRTNGTEKTTRTRKMTRRMTTRTRKMTQRRMKRGRTKSSITEAKTAKRSLKLRSEIFGNQFIV